MISLTHSLITGPKILFEQNYLLIFSRRFANQWCFCDQDAGPETLKKNQVEPNS
jgi:hypothetical protein